MPFDNLKFKLRKSEQTDYKVNDNLAKGGFEIYNFKAQCEYNIK